MNRFEVVLIHSPELTNLTLVSEIDLFKDKLKNNSGILIAEENWGLRDLSYNIKKFKKAFYNFFQIEISGTTIQNISKELSQSENLLRFLFVKVKEHQELPTKLNYEKK